MTTQKPISTIILPQNGQDIKLEIMREVEKDADWHNRYARSAETKEVLYYCVREPDMELNDTKLIFHRGGKDGPVIATADPCPQHKYETDIHFVEPKLTIPLKHKHKQHHFLCTNKKFHWKGHSDLLEDDTNNVVANFEPSWFEGNREKIGVLEVGQAPDIRDVVVITAMVVQERDEEFKSKSEMAWRRAAEMGAAK